MITMYKKVFLFLIAVVVLSNVFGFAVYDAEAQNLVLDGLKKTAANAGYDTNDVDLSIAVAKMISNLLAFLGVVLLVVMVAGGFMWMTAGGNADQAGKARQILGNAAVGVAVVFLSYALSAYVVSSLINATTATPTP